MRGFRAVFFEYVLSLLANEQIIYNLAKETPSLLEKIIAAIKDFIKELKEMAKKTPLGRGCSISG